MTTPARHWTPLTAPAADAWLVDPAKISENRREYLPRYGDAVWSFLFLNQNPSGSEDSFRWSRFPDAMREHFRLTAWALVNFPLEPGFLADRRHTLRSRLSSGRIARTVLDWAEFTDWLEGRGIQDLADVTADDLADYSQHLGRVRGLARSTTNAHLVALDRLHYYTTRYLPRRQHLVEAPWVREGMDDYLPAASSFGENVREPVTPETMGPLLVWALRFVELFADDILAAHAERVRLIQIAVNSSRGGRQGLRRGETAADQARAFFAELQASGRAIPVMSQRPGQPIASTFISGITGISIVPVQQVARDARWREYARQNPGPCLLDVPATAKLGGQLWQGAFDFDRVPALVKHLVTACFIVIAYLTGMRVGEVLGLEAGCCPDPDDPSDAVSRHLIYGRVFKVAVDDEGNHLSSGVMREAPWVAVPQVVTAVRVLERFSGEGLLFAAEAYDPRATGRRSGRSFAPLTFGTRMGSFVDWVNAYTAERGAESECIPPDECGRIGASRLRRTLAWHIARRPGGLVALAVQYGHMRTIISEGYAARSRGGIHDLLDLETARTVAEHLSDVHEALQDGQGVSGPASRRLIHAATQQQERFGGMITTMRQARSLLSDPTLNVFENKRAYLNGK